MAVEFVPPLGLRAENNQQWNIDVVDDPSSESNGNLRFNANNVIGGDKFLEIDDEFGDVGIGVDISNFPNNARLRVTKRDNPDDALGNVAIVASGKSIGISASAFNDDDDGVGGFFFGDGRAGVFVGDVDIIGIINPSLSLISVDNPLDPENKSLNHAGICSSEMINVYSGNVTLDENGEAIVKLAAWVEAYNKDFRYQLTCISGNSSVYIAKEFSDNSFQIAGGTPDTKVSWQLTGVRKDPWAQAHPLIVELDKPKDQRGYYRNPELYDQPENKRIVFAEQAELIDQLRGTGGS